MFNKQMANFVAFLITLSATGFASAQTQPNAGSLLNEQKPIQTVPPKGKAVLPKLAEPASTSTESTPIEVERLRVLGSTVFSAEVLEALVADVAGQQRSLRELQIAAARITAYYRRAGYSLARAYLPQQKMQDGLVTIEVLEGRLEKVQIDNVSRLSDGVVQARLSGVKTGEAFNKSATDRALLLLSDTPGAGVVNSRFAPGSQRGESVLVTKLDGAPLVSGRLEADNHGGLYTGRNRLGASADLNSALGYGERFSGKLLASDGELYNASLAALVPLGSDGLTLGAAVSYNTYALGNTFSVLDAVGHSTTAELNVRYPWVRSVDFNLYSLAGYEYRKLKDEIRSTATVTEKHANLASITLFGDMRDGLGGGGLTQVNLTLSSGHLSFDSPSAAALDAVGAKTAGSYTKLALSLERQQALPANFHLNLRLRSQWTDYNLDSSEKFGLGGPYGVRAYASNEALGDRGWFGSMELRYNINQWLAANVFHDHGEVSVNAHPYLSTANTLRRSGNGFGVTGNYGTFDWRAYAAWRDGEVGTAEPDKRGRLWLQAGWRF